MALQISLKNVLDFDTIHAVVRLDRKNHLALKQYMHCTDSVVIRFPHGVTLASRGRGWYRLDVTNSYRALEKLQFAIKCINRFWRDEERKTEEALKSLVPLMVDPDLKIVSFSTAHSEGEYGYIGSPHELGRVPPTQNKLNALILKFQRH